MRCGLPAKLQNALRMFKIFDFVSAILAYIDDPRDPHRDPGKAPFLLLPCQFEMN